MHSACTVLQILKEVKYILNHQKLFERLTVISNVLNIARSRDGRGLVWKDSFKCKRDNDYEMVEDKVYLQKRDLQSEVTK